MSDESGKGRADNLSLAIDHDVLLIANCISGVDEQIDEGGRELTGINVNLK